MPSAANCCPARATRSARAAAPIRCMSRRNPPGAGAFSTQACSEVWNKITASYCSTPSAGLVLGQAGLDITS